MPEHSLYTIGYAAFFRIEDFLAALHGNDIGAVVDVRAQPEISSFAHYKGGHLKKVLAGEKIHYLSFAEEFGARTDDPALYSDGAVDFEKLADTPAFRTGCERIVRGLEKFNVCLMCAQRDPAVCHRAILITHKMAKLYPEITIRHIMPDGLLTQADIDEALKSRYALLGSSLDACYKVHGRSIAFRKN